MMDILCKAVAAGFGAMGVILGLSLIMVVPTWLIWNWIGPGVLGLPELTFWQTWGVLFLVHSVIPTRTVESST